MEMTDNSKIRILCMDCQFNKGLETLSIPDSPDGLIDLFVKCSKIPGGSMNAKKMLCGCPINSFQRKDYENG